MKIADQVETIYLAILRYTILLVATVTMIAVAYALIMAAPLILASPPAKPKAVDPQQQIAAPKDAFTVAAYLKTKNTVIGTDSESAPSAFSSPAPDEFRVFQEKSAQTVFHNLTQYLQASGKRYDDPQAVARYILLFPSQQGINSEAGLRLYWTTLVSLTADVLQQHSNPSPAQQPFDSSDLPKLMVWHATRVKAAMARLEQANLRRQSAYAVAISEYDAEKGTASMYVRFALYAFGVFIAVLLTFLIVKIERDLRTIAEGQRS